MSERLSLAAKELNETFNQIMDKLGDHEARVEALERRRPEKGSTAWDLAVHVYADLGALGVRFGSTSPDKIIQRIADAIDTPTPFKEGHAPPASPSKEAEETDE